MPTAESDSTAADACGTCAHATQGYKHPVVDAKVAMDSPIKTSVAEASHPLDPLSRAEILRASAAALKALPNVPDSSTPVRFSYVTLREPEKKAVAAWAAGMEGGDAGASHVQPPPRVAEAVLIVPATGLAYQVLVELAAAAAPSTGASQNPVGMNEQSQGICARDCSFSSSTEQSGLWAGLHYTTLIGR
jgi:Cu2+-containing amine oxidase